MSACQRCRDTPSGSAANCMHHQPPLPPPPPPAPPLPPPVLPTSTLQWVTGSVQRFNQPNSVGYLIRDDGSASNIQFHLSDCLPQWPLPSAGERMQFHQFTNGRGKEIASCVRRLAVPLPPTAPNGTDSIPSAPHPSAAPLPSAVLTPDPVDWKTTAWFQASEGDLVRSHGLLERCAAKNEAALPLVDDAVTRHAIALIGFYEQLQIEQLIQRDGGGRDEEGDSVLTLVTRAMELLRQDKTQCKVVDQLRVDVVEALTDVQLGCEDNGDAVTQWTEFIRGGEVGTLPPSVVASTLGHISIAIQRDHSPSPVVDPQSAHLWTVEIQRLVSSTTVDEAEESRRQAIANHIAATLHNSAQWYPWGQRWLGCRVLVFGSSLSKFGSHTSDLDLCLVHNGDDASTVVEGVAADAILRQRRLRLTQKRDGAQDSAVLRETLAKARKAVAIVATTQSRIVRADAAKQSLILSAHWNALIAALESATAAMPPTAAPSLPRPPPQQQQHQENKVYEVVTLLGASGHRVVEALAHTRVPLVKFVHMASNLACDLTVSNYLACINTQLLRAYATVDDRVRSLGVAVKHWAKRRGINDAAVGYLSSYSFIILVIYYLQINKVVPNLQDKRLLQYANQPTALYRGMDVSFCRDVAAARAWHRTQTTDTSDTSPESSVGELLVGFFAFYTREFAIEQRVVSITAPHKCVDKRVRWRRGPRDHVPLWRMSIADPFDRDRDLGSVLEKRGQARVQSEMQRALELLSAGDSFVFGVCAQAEELQAMRMRQQGWTFH